MATIKIAAPALPDVTPPVAPDPEATWPMLPEAPTEPAPPPSSTIPASAWSG